MTSSCHHGPALPEGRRDHVGGNGASKLRSIITASGVTLLSVIVSARRWL
jgi:hypothetical protein